MLRRIYEIEGIVQGVGFRPGIYCFAVKLNIGGWIKNFSGKVKLAIEGTEQELNSFITSVYENIPRQAKIQKITLLTEETCNNKSCFKILESGSDSSYQISIPADLAMCTDCADEIMELGNRRYHYPFTTCVNCGPRYTVINAVPYDRCRTTLSEFPLCPECEKEYRDPANRRFHAESTACPVCGPALFWCDSKGKSIESSNPVKLFRNGIRNGKIIAVRGIGGYLLAVDAFNNKSIVELRKRKNRPHKPFAVMAQNIDIIKKYCYISELEEECLKSPNAPIVILDIKDKKNLPMELLSPDTDTIGVMLPYSPMHMLLFADDIELLIMTSGNKGGEPICIKNSEAFERLQGIADAFLCHNRDINLRNDDSLCIKQNDRMQIWRRARGFAPESIELKESISKTVLSMGAELKNTLTLAYDNEAVISPHIGDLETPEAIDGLKEVSEYFPKFFKKVPEIIATDLHPDMHSTRLGNKIADNFGINSVKIQHHFAHGMACMTEHDLHESFALVYDGTGLGTDGSIWGAELLYIKDYKFERVSTYEQVPLPGGDAAVYNPLRQLIGRWFKVNRNISKELLSFYNISEEEIGIWKIQCDKGINAPLSHAAGRLFDAFSVLIGVSPGIITYEGQGAIKLEAAAKRVIAESNVDNLPKIAFKLEEKNDLLYVNWDDAFNMFSDNEIINIANNFELQSRYALSFHNAVAEVSIKQIEYGLSKYSSKNLVLSGGVFMNRILTDLIRKLASDKLGLNIFIHEETPPNDGCISLGQAVAASWL
ncbi:MAG: carbamoyltransferase HypF [bacterium]|nr:carbamoyltransferase HypF [bacterium]